MEKTGFRANLELLNEMYPLPKVLLTMPEAAAVTGIKATRLPGLKGFPAQVIGKRYKVSKADLARWMSSGR